MEALRVLTLGYPTRVPYQELYDKYHASVDNPLLRNMGAATFSTSLLIAFDVAEEDYELGLTKIFFKPAKAAVLETIMSKAGQPLSAEQNAKITRYLVAKRAKQLVGATKAFCLMSRMVRRARAQKLWAQFGRVAAIEGATVVKTLNLARQRIRERKRQAASLLMQKFVRCAMERKQFLTRVQNVKQSTTAILSAYTVMEQRAGVAQCLDAKVAQRREREEREERERIADAKAAAAVAVATTATTVVVDEPVKPVTKPVVSRDEQLAQARAERKAKADADRIQKEEEDAARVKKEQEAAAAAEKQRIEDERAKAEAMRAQEAAAATVASTSPAVAGKADVNTLDPIASDSETKTSDKDDISDRIEVNMDLRAQADRKVKKKARKYKHKKKQSMMRRKYRAMPGTTYDDSDSDNGNESEPEYVSDPDEFNMEEELRIFPSTAKQGQLFFRHAGSRRRTKAQDRVIKVSFDHKGEPSEISWGRGSRHIMFKDILYIAHGWWTPTFELRKEHTDEFSDRSARDNYKNLMAKNKERRPSKKPRKDVLPIVQLQQDLFVMSLSTVFRHLEEERIWMISPEVRQKFTPQILYPIVLKQDVPWRQWQAWIREKVTAYCRDNNLVNAYTAHNSRHSLVMMESAAVSVPSPQPKVQPQVQPVVNSHTYNTGNSNNSHEEKCSLM